MDPKPKKPGENAPTHPPVGSVLAGRYHLEALIAVGGMGAVFRATDSFLDQPVAIKVLTVKKWGMPEGTVAQTLQSLRAEALMSIKLTDPGIVRAYNYERDASWEFLVMEYVKGQDLRHYRKKFEGKIVPESELIRIGLRALEALEHAHKLGVSHYDIKPANVLLTDQGDVKLCDFGLASLSTAAMQRAQEQRPRGIVAGTPAYIAPEMIEGNKADHRADLYSLSATLYDLANGEAPFGSDAVQAYIGHLQQQPAPLSNVSRAFNALILKGLEKDPARRFQSAAEMRAALAACAAQSTAQSITAQGERSMRVQRRSYSYESKKWESGQALPSEMDSDRTLVLVFGAPEAIEPANKGAFEQIAKAFSKSHVVGASTSGEIAGSAVMDRSLSVAITQFGSTELHTVEASVSDAAKSFDAGKELAQKLSSAKPGLRAVFVLSEGLTVNGSELVRGFNSALDPSVLVTGGLAGDGTRFAKTWVLRGASARSGLVVAVGLYGDSLIVSHGSKGGWDKFGPERKVTKSKANVVFEIDGKPALKLYKEYLGPKAAGLPATGLLFPLAMRQSDSDSKILVRTLLAVDEAAQSMTFAGDVPEGSLVQLMKADFDRLVGGASDAATMAVEQRDEANDSDVLTVAISCVGRRLVLGERIDEEVEAIQSVLPKKAQVVGFYSYGELAPYGMGACDLHNQTMTLTVFAEREGTAPKAAAPKPPPPPAKPAPSLSRFAVPAQTKPTSPASLPKPAASAPPSGEPMRVQRRSYSYESKKWESGQALPSEMDSDRTLVLVFGAPEAIEPANKGAFEQIAKAFSKSHVVGASTSGEIAGSAVMDHSLSVAITQFGSTELHTVEASVSDAAKSFDAGKELAQKLSSAKPGLRAVFVLSEGLTVNGSELVRGFNSALDPSVLVTGGLAGDGTRFGKTWVLRGASARSGVVVAVGLYGDSLIVSHGSKGGWDKFGPERRVTKSKANVVFEIDGKPALKLYKEYLGPKAAGLPATGLLFPLAMRQSDSDSKILVRTLLAVDEAAQSMTFAGDVPEGSLVQLMKADFDRLVGGASDAATMAVEQRDEANDSDVLTVAISCVGRRLVLGERIDEEVEAIQSVLPKKAQVVGFYSYGELAPYGMGACDLHNQTMTLTVFAERHASAPTKVSPRVAAVAPREEPVTNVAPPAPPPPRPAPAPAAAPAPTSADSIMQRSPAAAAIQRLRTAPHRGAASKGASTCVIERAQTADATLVVMSGRMNETLKGRAAAEGLSGLVVFDLANIERVTSFGVREWLQLLSAAQRTVERFYLVNCSEAVVNQLSTIRAFAGGGTIVSFEAPYRCRSCGFECKHILDVEQDAEAIRNREPPKVECPKCQRAAEFDDDADTYFAFAVPFAGAAIPEAVRAVLEGADQTVLVPSTGPEQVQKDIEESATRVRIRGKLDRTLRWNRILDGLEGAIIFDFESLTDATPDGASALLSALRQLPEEVSSAEIHSCPRAVIEAMMIGGAPPVTVCSAEVDGFCAQCNTRRMGHIDVARDRAAMAAGEDPKVLCKRCEGAISFADVRPMLRFLAQSGEVKRATVAPAQAAPAPSQARISEPTPSPIAAPAKVEEKQKIPAIAVGLIVVGVLGIGAAGLLLRQRDNGGSNAQSPHAAVTVPTVTATPDVAPTSAASEPNASADALLPAWTERATAIDATRVTVVGHAEAQPSRDAAMSVARDHATYRLLTLALEQLRGTRAHSFIDTRVRSRTFDAGALHAIAQRYEQQHGSTAAPERAEVLVRQGAAGTEVFAQYRLDRAAFDAMVEAHRAREEFRGMVTGRFFALLEPVLPSSPDVIVYEVRASTPASAADLRDGDGVLAINGQRVTALSDFRAVVDRTWAGLPVGSTLRLLVSAAGAERTITMSKPRSEAGHR